MPKTWTLYILTCADGTLYTGITVDLERRLEEHNAGKGARYTRARLPVSLAFSTPCDSHTHAAKLEYRVKALPRKEKLAIIKAGLLPQKLIP